MPAASERWSWERSGCGGAGSSLIMTRNPGGGPGAGWGVFTNQASHHIDMLAWMLGRRRMRDGHDGPRGWRRSRRRYGHCHGSFLQRRPGGDRGDHRHTAQGPRGSISILGEKGAVEIGGFFMNDLKTWQFLRSPS